jgi:RNA polymerase sigma factor (sigma-70 family)
VLADDPAFRSRLQAMIRREFRPDPELEQDLMQEALLHLCRLENRGAQGTRGWHVESCRFHLLHYLDAGRSLDSPKRAARRISIHAFPADDQYARFWDDFLDPTDSLSELIARDMLSALRQRLGPRDWLVLNGLYGGLSLSEIAQALSVSVCAVSKRRDRIADQARRLGFRRWPSAARRTMRWRPAGI